MPRSRWTKARLARAAFLVGQGRTLSQIADDREIGSTMFSVQAQLHAVGLCARRDDDRERLIAVPLRVFTAFTAVARARRRHERPEEVMAKVLAILAEEPAMVGNVLDDDEDGTFNLRVLLEQSKIAVAAEVDAQKVDRSVALKRVSDASASAA